MAKKDRVRMTVWVEFEHREWLRRQAYDRDTSMAQILHDLIEDAARGANSKGGNDLES